MSISSRQTYLAQRGVVSLYAFLEQSSSPNGHMLKSEPSMRGWRASATALARSFVSARTAGSCATNEIVQAPARPPGGAFAKGGSRFCPSPKNIAQSNFEKDERTSAEPAAWRWWRSCGWLARVHLASDSRRIIALQRNDPTWHVWTLRVGKSFLQGCSIGRRSHLFRLVRSGYLGMGDRYPLICRPFKI